jgi:hypothetical protein
MTVSSMSPFRRQEAKMMGRTTYCAILLIAGGLCVAASQATDKTAVMVKFRVAEPDYNDQYATHEIEPLQANLSTEIGTLFNEHIGFLNFITGGTADYSLTVELDRQNPQAPGPYWEVGFWVKMTGSEMNPPPAFYWVMFRPAESYGDCRGSVTRLTGDLIFAFKQLQDLDYDKLVAKVLQHVPICGGSVQLSQPPDPIEWILPYTRRELLMDSGSLLNMKNCVQLPGKSNWYDLKVLASGVLGQYPDRPDDQPILCTPAEKTANLDALERADRKTISVENVRVIEYHRYELSFQGSVPLTSGGPNP